MDLLILNQNVAVVKGHAVHLFVQSENVLTKRILISVFRVRIIPVIDIDNIAKGYPTLLSDGKRIKDIGIDAWIEEQEVRAKSGFAYVDIRCYPYEVPDK